MSAQSLFTQTDLSSQSTGSISSRPMKNKRERLVPLKLVVVVSSAATSSADNGYIWTTTTTMREKRPYVLMQMSSSSVQATTTAATKRRRAISFAQIRVLFANFPLSK